QATACFTAFEGQVFQDLEKFRAKHPHCWMPGFLRYDLKNEIEELTTSSPNRLGFPEAYFFIPAVIISFRRDQVEIQGLQPETIYNSIFSTEFPTEPSLSSLNIEVRKRMSKEAYIEAFNQMIQHIQQGDIYEVNLCQEFYAEKVSLSPLAVYERLNKVSPTPFSCFFKISDKYILSASPERFLAKREQTLISQPIKGTAPRGKTTLEDKHIIDALKNNPKEIAENVMIVDLVRNDLTRSAVEGSVKADRRLEVHTFEQVHQLISTVTCKKNPTISDITAIRQTFPAGSMTGAPTISAMKLCDCYENSRRGVYAGTVGYFDPLGNFDFNVVIRSLLYNSTNRYL